LSGFQFLILWMKKLSRFQNIFFAESVSAFQALTFAKMTQKRKSNYISSDCNLISNKFLIPDVNSTTTKVLLKTILFMLWGKGE